MLLTGLISSRRRQRTRGVQRDAHVATASRTGRSFREIERLETRRLLTVPTSPLFPLDGTGFGQVSGDITDGSQPELFRFEPQIGGRYVFEQNPDASSLDSFLRVLDENCDVVTSNDDGGPGLDSRLELFVSGGDVFFLEAGSFGSSTGAFTLTVTRDDVDNSLSTNGAIFLSQEGNGSIFGEIERTGDRDLFAITSQLTGTLTIQQNDADPGFFNSFVRVFDSNGTFIVSNDDFNGINSQVEISVSAGEQLLIQASSFSAPGLYQVAVSGDFGDTDSAATPVTVAATGRTSVSGEIDDSNDVDVFQIESPVNGTLTFDLSEASGFFDSFLRVRNQSGALIALDDDSGPGLDSQIQLAVSSGDILFLEAAGAFGSSGSYALSIVPDDFSGDVDGDTATPIILAADGSGSQTGTIGIPGDRDVFLIDATTTGILTIRLNAASTDGFDLDPLLTVFDQDGILVAQNDDSGSSLNSRLDIPVTLGQRLLVKASGFADFSTGDYELTFQPLAVGDDDFGNSVQEATPLTFDAAGFVLQPGVIEQPDDRDVFSVTAPAGAGTLTIRQVSPDGELDAFLRIPDATGLTTVSNDDFGFSLDSQIILPVTPGEEVFIQAGSFPGSAGRYNLLIQAGDAIADDAGNDNANALALSLAPISNDFVTPGTLEVQGDQDVYTTTFDADGTVQVSLEAASGGFLDTFLRVRNVADDLVAFDDDSGLGLNSQTTVSVSANQQLFFDVGAFADASSGDYFLTVLFQPGVITADDVPINTIAQALSANPLPTLAIPADGILVTGNIEVPLDRDVFAFTVPGTSIETVDVRIRQLAAGRGVGAFGFGLDPLLRVFDSSGVQIAFNDDSFISLDSEVFLTVAGGARILVQAGAFGSSTGQFDLILDVLDDDFVNTPDGSTTLEFEAAVSGSIEVSGDVDVFRIGMPDRTGLPPAEDVRVQVRQTATDGTFDAFLTVFRELDDGSIQFVALNDDSDGLNSVVEFDLKLDANYLVFAEAFGSTTGNYDLSIVDLSQVVVDDDFGNTIENAQGIEVAGLAAIEPLVGNIESTGDVDVFRFTSARNGSALVELSPEPGLDGRISVFEINPDVSPDDPEREVRIARSSFTPVSPGGDGLPAITAEFPLIRGREYAIAVDSESGTATGSYAVDLALSDDLVADDGKIPDNVFEAVTALVRAEFAAGTDFDQILERATAEFVSAIGNVGENGFFLFLADPVDFVLADSQNRRVGFTTDQGRVNETPGAQLSQDAPIEVLILSTTDRQFPVQLQGVGSNFQIGGRVVTQAGVLNGSLTTSSGATTAGSGTLSKNDGNVALVFDFTQNTTPPVTPIQRIPQPVDPAPAEVANLIATDADTTAFQFLPGDQIAIAEEAVRAAQDLRDADDNRQSAADVASGPNLLQSLIDYLHKSEQEGLRSLAGSLEFLIDSDDGDDSDDDTGVSGSDVFWSVFGGGVMNHLWELGDQIIEQISESDADSESAESPEPDQTQPESTESPEGGRRTGKDKQSQTPQPGSEATPPSSKETQPAPDGAAQEAAATSQPQKQTSPGSSD